MARSNGGREDSSMYSALGNYNAELRQTELTILAEEDVVAHLKAVKKEAQEEHESLSMKLIQLQLQHNSAESAFEKAKVSKASVKNEIQHHQNTLVEMQESLARKQAQIDLLNQAKITKRQQFQMLKDKRREMFEATPRGQLHRQAREEVAKKQETLKRKQLKMEKLSCNLVASIKAQRQNWIDFTKLCVKTAEHQVKHRPTQSEPIKAKANILEVPASRKSAVGSGWSQLYLNKLLPSLSSKRLSWPQPQFSAKSDEKQRLLAETIQKLQNADYFTKKKQVQATSIAKRVKPMPISIPIPTTENNQELVSYSQESCDMEIDRSASESQNSINSTEIPLTTAKSFDTLSTVVPTTTEVEMTENNQELASQEEQEPCDLDEGVFRRPASPAPITGMPSNSNFMCNSTPSPRDFFANFEGASPNAKNNDDNDNFFTSGFSSGNNFWSGAGNSNTSLF